MYKKIKKCRICGNKNLKLVLDLGNQKLTGIFPREIDTDLSSGPLRLVKCSGSNVCGLLQLEHSYDLDEMYGDNYGYRSGLNDSMVTHLQNKIKKILTEVDLSISDLVIDIGSNDCTTLKAYPSQNANLVGVDPTGEKFKDYYPPYIKLIPDFFSSSLIKQQFPNFKAKIITSFSMFYDLEDPMKFMQDVYEVLDDEGLWIFEQSYMPTMLKMNSYDTVCHEHLEFYSLHQIKWMTDRVGFKIIDVELNEINGGSFSISVAKSNSKRVSNENVNNLLQSEIAMKLDELSTYTKFVNRIEKTRNDLLKFINLALADGKKIAGLGASTKGNVLLQYCGLTSNEISNIGEINQDKFGCITPGSWIPIIDEKLMLSTKPDYLIILPWHFKDSFLKNKIYEESSLVFPLPELTIIDKKV